MKAYRKKEEPKAIIPERVNMTVPEKMETLFRWYVRHDPRFRGKSAAAVAAHFFEAGLRADYERGLAAFDGMDADEFGPLAAEQGRVLAAALEDAS